MYRGKGSKGFGKKVFHWSVFSASVLERDEKGKKGGLLQTKN
jgi:hypothetical protein